MRVSRRTEEVALLRLQAVLEKFGDILTHSGCNAGKDISNIRSEYVRPDVPTLRLWLARVPFFVTKELRIVIATEETRT